MTGLTPGFALAMLLVLLSAFLFHAICGRDARGLLASLIASLAGFLIGEAVARGMGHGWGAVGEVHVAHGLAGAWVAMVVARLRGP